MKLSICIPTYNRVVLLRETLDSIVPQLREGVEIVICDNASPDATPELVAEYQQNYPGITYFRWPENSGFDRNILKVVEVAGGDYCWLLGDDDHLQPGALDCLLPLLDGKYSLIYLNAMTYDSTMGRFSNRTISRFDCENADQALLSVGSWITFISSLCVQRTDFMRFMGEGVAHIGSGFAHCYPVLNILRQGNNLIVREPLVKFRACNTGGYNIFQMFIVEFNRILAYCEQIGFSSQIICSVKTRNVYQAIIPALLQIKIGKLNIAADNVWSYLPGSGLRLAEKLLLILMACSPPWLMKGMRYLKRKIVPL